MRCDRPTIIFSRWTAPVRSSVLAERARTHEDLRAPVDMHTYVVKGDRFCEFTELVNSPTFDAELAMARRFGPPSCFLTIAPDDVHDPTSVAVALFDRARRFSIRLC